MSSSHYTFAQYADRTLGLVLYKHPDGSLWARRFRRTKPFPSVNPEPPTDPFELDTRINGSFSFTVSVSDNNEGLLALEATGWAEFWVFDQALLLGVQDGFAGNQVEAPVLPNWPATTTGPTRTVNLDFTVPAAGGVPFIQWSSPGTAGGKVEFRQPNHVKAKHGLAVVLRLRGKNGGRLTLNPGNPWGAQQTIEHPPLP